MEGRHLSDPYACERFSAARGSLAEDPNKIQERVAYVFKYDLWLIADHPNLSADIVERLSTYAEQILGTPDPKDQGRINIWASKLSDGEAMAIARWVCDCAARLEFEAWAARTNGPSANAGSKRQAGRAAKRETPATDHANPTPSNKAAVVRKNSAKKR